MTPKPHVDFSSLIEAYMKPMREFTARFLDAVNGLSLKPFVVPVCAEMRYGTLAGEVEQGLNPNDREQLHSALDEWINTSRGTGYFYIGNLTQLRNDLEEL